MTDPDAPYGRDMGGAPLGQSIDDRMAGKPDLLKQAQEAKMPTVDSKSDERTVNNTMRHKYRVLSEAEKAQMQAVKDKGQEFLDLIDSLRTPAEEFGDDDDHDAFVVGTIDRELNIAAERAEEAVMWAVKHITA